MHGKRGHFIKLFITLKSEQYKKVVMKSVERKINRRKDHRIRDVIRDAMNNYFRN